MTRFATHSSAAVAALLVAALLWAPVIDIPAAHAAAVAGGAILA